MLTFDPRQRITAAEALLHPFFAPPAPATPLGAPGAAAAPSTAAAPAATAARVAPPLPAPSTAGTPPCHPTAAKQHRSAVAPAASSAASAAAAAAAAVGQPCLLLQLLPPAELAVLSRQISDPLQPQPAARLSACARGLRGPMVSTLPL